MSETKTWTVQAGRDGAWKIVTGPYPRRKDALEQLAWRQDLAPEGLRHRLKVVTTTIATSHEYPDTEK